MRAFAQEQLEEARAELPDLEERLRLEMLERDPADDHNVLVELRAGTGGDEAAIFAGDLHQMLTRYADSRGFKTEVVTTSGGDVGGFKELVFEIRGDGAYSVFKFESGVHRVQRVPETESQGRIHTSTATVAVLPEPEDVEVQVEQADLRIDVYRAGGHGGQSVQHHRLGRADHPSPHDDGGDLSGRAFPAPEQGAGDEDSACAAVRAGA